MQCAWRTGGCMNGWLMNGWSGRWWMVQVGDVVSVGWRERWIRWKISRVSSATGSINDITVNNAATLVPRRPPALGKRPSTPNNDPTPHPQPPARYVTVGDERAEDSARRREGGTDADACSDSDSDAERNHVILETVPYPPPSVSADLRSARADSLHPLPSTTAMMTATTPAMRWWYDAAVTMVARRLVRSFVTACHRLESSGFALQVKTRWT